MHVGRPFRERTGRPDQTHKIKHQRRTSMSTFKTLLALGCGLTLFSAAAQAQQEIKLGHVGEPGSLFDRSAQELAKRANEKLAGKAKVSVYGSSQLGGDTELLKKLKLGTV